MRVLRRGKETFHGEIASLKHLQDDVREVRSGFECGVTLKGFDSFETGDILECFILEKAPAS
jgi:translation initiation factor IF-2